MSMWDGVECLVEACTLPALHTWLCKKHGSMWNRSGRTWRIRADNPESTLKEKSKTLDSGCVVWTGYIHPSGYGQMGYKGKTAQVHRVAWRCAGRDIPTGMFLDHLCYNKACFNAQHLRLVTRKQNAENLPKPPSNNTSGYRGVSWSARYQKYVAQIGHNGRNLYLGRYADREEAAEVARQARLNLFTHNEKDKEFS